MMDENDYGEFISGETTITLASFELGNLNFKTGLEKITNSKRPIGIELTFITETIEADFQQAIRIGATEFAPLIEKPWGQKVGCLRDNNGLFIKN